MLLCKSGYSFHSTEDENLWNPSRLCGLMDQDPPKVTINTPKTYFTQQKAGSSLERTMPKFPK